MALTHADALLRDTARAAFWQGFEAYPDILAGLTARFPSDADQESYDWLAYAPGVQEMVGDRIVKDVPAINWVIKNKLWENTVRVSYRLRKHGKNNVVAEWLKQLGAKASAYPSELIAGLINTGDATACYDTANFFGAAHVDPGADYTTSQDNDFTTNIAATAAATDLEMQAELRIAYAAFNGFKDGDGDPVVPNGSSTFVVLVPAGHLPAALSVFKSDALTGPISNDMKGMFEPRLNPWSDSDAEIFTFWTNGVKKPFIHQVATEVRLEDNLGGDMEFRSKDAEFGSFADYNIGYGDWRYATRHIFT